MPVASTALRNEVNYETEKKLYCKLLSTIIMKQITNCIRFLPIVALALLYSCESAETTDSAIVQSTVEAGFVDENSILTAKKVRDIFYSVPSPMEMASILKRTGATYDMTLLNDVKKVHSYSSARRQALNLGVYGADLSYVSVFNQNQEAIIYMSCTKKLADNLGVSKAFDDQMIERMETNVDNRDSLLSLISETYYMLDAYLKENDRDHISAMVIAAGWVEGLYLATSIASSDGEVDMSLIQRIAEQKISLDNLRDLVNTYNRRNQLDGIANDLDKIHEAYHEVSISSEGSNVEKLSDGTTRIGGKTKVEMSQKTLEVITRVVSEIRSNYIS